MKQFFITLAGVFAGLMLFFVGIPILLIIVAVGAAQPAATPDDSVLELDLRDPISDQDARTPFAALSGRMSVMKIVRTLDRAGRDDAVEGLLVRLPEGGMEPAAAEEIRLAIRAFRARGKFVLAHSQGLYQSGMVASTYMLGAAADQFWMQDGAPFQATGAAAEELFLAGFFQRYGIVADYQQRYEFKNAANAFTQTDYTPEHRAATLGWLGSVYGNALSIAAADRRQNAQVLRAAFEAGPYAAADARSRGLIDRIGSVAEVEAEARRRAGAEADAELVDFGDYAGSNGDDAGSGPVIAVVGAEGAIMTGRGDGNPFAASSDIRSDDVAADLRAAAEDDDVRAIVFRISSPGGSDTASEQILSAVRAARAAGKPVVVSMGTYAASGGYWIASGANAIVAEPSTLTGSIGVFGGKLAVDEALNRFGLNLSGVSVGGDFAGAYASGEPFTDPQRAAFSAWMDRIYEGFIVRVATGRRLPVARVREIARGRVWTGSQARQLGLVDELGGLTQAVARAKREARIADDAEVRLRWIDSEQSFWEALGAASSGSTAALRTLSVVAGLAGDPRAQRLLDAAAESRLRDRGATVLAPTPVG